MIKQYRKKPVVIEAMQFETNNEPDTKHMDEIVDWINESSQDRTARHDNTWIYIQTLEGEMTAKVKDYIIKGVQGEFYPCKPDIFEATYEPVAAK